MEIEIQSKSNNPLLNRTEVHFIIRHEGESTPKREFIRGELAEKLNVKKENIMINYMKSSFGITETLGYAKVYKSLKEAKDGEREYILKRNNVVAKEKKAAKEEEKKSPVEQPEAKPKEGAEKPAEETAVKPVEKTKEEPAEKSEEGTKKPEEETTVKPDEGKKESTEKPVSEEKITKEKPDEKKSEEGFEKPEGEEKSAEEKGK